MVLLDMGFLVDRFFFFENFEYFIPLHLASIFLQHNFISKLIKSNSGSFDRIVSEVCV